MLLPGARGAALTRDRSREQPVVTRNRPPEAARPAATLLPAAHGGKPLAIQPPGRSTITGGVGPGRKKGIRSDQRRGAPPTLWHPPAAPLGDPQGARPTVGGPRR